MGIIEIDKKFSKFLETKETIKNIELTSTEMEAAYYFISKYNSEGLKRCYIFMIKY